MWRFLLFPCTVQQHEPELLVHQKDKASVVFLFVVDKDLSVRHCSRLSYATTKTFLRTGVKELQLQKSQSNVCKGEPRVAGTIFLLWDTARVVVEERACDEKQVCGFASPPCADS